MSVTTTRKINEIKVLESESRVIWYFKDRWNGYFGAGEAYLSILLREDKPEGKTRIKHLEKRKLFGILKNLPKHPQFRAGVVLNPNDFDGKTMEHFLPIINEAKEKFEWIDIQQVE